LPFHASRAAQNLSKKKFKLFERSEFLNFRQIRAAQGSLPLADQVNGCPFFDTNVGQAVNRRQFHMPTTKMNILKQLVY
jgi:hypothetical protein